MSELQQARTHVDALRSRLINANLVETNQEFGVQALQELDVAHEELRVVEEELHAQAEEILATRELLEEEQRRYRDLFNTAPEAYLVTDEEGVVLEANRRAGVLFNLDVTHVLRKPLRAFVALSDRDRFHSVLRRIMERTFRGELRMQPHRSDAIAVQISAHLSKGAHGRANAIRWMMLPARKETGEASPQDARIKDLEHAKAALEAELHQAELERVALAAELTGKNHVLAELGHELRAPLGSIAGWLRILTQEHGERQLQDRGLMSVTRGVRALTHLAEELMQHAQLEEKKVELEREPLNLLRVVTEVMEDLRPVAMLKHIRVELDSPSDALNVRGDLERLHQVFRNIIGNAIKFTPEGGAIRIQARIERTSAAITVTDTGSGIQRDDLGKIFEPFAQAAAHGRKPADGIGLGLSIAKRLIESHGGTVEASSEGPDRGASFTVRLPLIAIS